MKRFFALLLICALLLAACGADKNAPNTIRDGKTLSELTETVRSQFCEEYGAEEIVAMPMPVDRTYLSDMLGIASEDVAETAGWISMSIAHADAFFAVRAAEGRADAVTQALADHARALTAQYEVYPAEGALERARAARVLQKGDYAFFICVGAGEDPDCGAQVQDTIDRIDALFN